jgi:hypothetical protein
MECEFHLQDPTSPQTVYLFEAIIGAARGATSCTGMFAFASRGGVDSLIGDPEMQQLLSGSTMSLLVGIDAITNRSTLLRLQELELEYERLTVRVFWNPTNTLFHPKVARFEYGDGRRALIVGSGNLTPGGLRQNFEAFSVVRTAANEVLDLMSWDRFLADHAMGIRAIDDAALERAAANVVRGGRRRPDVEPDVGSSTEPEPAAAPGASDFTQGDGTYAGRSDRFLVARVPKAGGRWHQVHFNVEVIQRFFRVQHDTTQRVYLVECHQEGTFGQQEVRPCVYSEANKNLKIEIASHHGAPYPSAGPPIAVYRELQARSFAYMLLFPGDPGYAAMFALTERLPSVGRGLPRVITDHATISTAWASSPLVTAIGALSANEE